jgi:HK97 family phage prohead protease
MFKPETREYRSFTSFQAIENKSDNPAYHVHGRAVVFEQPTCLFEYEGIKYYEVIDRNAFAFCDMSDVIMNYNHGGKPVARLRNKTLALNITHDGVDVDAYLAGTHEGRNLYEEINGGYIDKMSWAFIVDENGGDTYDPETHTRRILRVKKLYDVAAVDFPAYEQTSLSARRSYMEEHIKDFARLESEQRRKKLIIMSLC